MSLILVFVFAVVIFIWWGWRRYTVPILTYHHVGDVSSEILRLNTVSTDSFEKQMAFIRNNGYNVISFDQLIKGMEANQKFPRNTVLVQFDDGYLNNYTDAFPALKKYKIPATIFLVSDKIGKDQEYLTWDQVKEMEKAGIEMGSHTRFHAYLPSLPKAQLIDEIVGSKKIIEENLGHRIDYFAYPCGGLTPEAAEMVKKAGYKGAVTTNRGKDNLNRAIYEINRIRIKEEDLRHNGIILRAKLSGYYNLFRKPRITTEIQPE